MSKKWLIIFLLPLGIIVSIFIANNTNYKCYLTTNDYGWSCKIDNFEEVSFLEQKCKDQGGYGHRWTNEYYCNTLPEDGGTPCTASDQCRGKCVVSREYITENIPTFNASYWPNYPYIECINCTGNCSYKGTTRCYYN